MQPTPAHPENDPGYPDAREFARLHKAALGAILLGTGLALGGCGESGRTAGSLPPPKSDPNEARVTGKIPAEPANTPPPSGETPPRLPGDVSVVPKVGQPPPGGVPPVVPQPENTRN